MHPVDRAIRLKEFKAFLIKTGLALALAAYVFVDKNETIGAISGFALFSGNIYLLAVISRLVFTIIAKGDNTKPKNNSGLIGFLIFFKFSFLALALYLLIVTFKISGIAIFVGSLISVFSISAYLSIKYMEYLAKLKIERKKAQDAQPAKENLNPQPVEKGTSYKSLVTPTN